MCVRQNKKKSLKFHEYFLDLFDEEPVPTEHTAYKLLKEEPIAKDINYLVVPWTVLINTNQLHKVPDIKLNGGFTVCQHIHYEKIIPVLKKIGIDTLFTPHVNKTYDDIRVLPFPHFATNGISPAKHKDIFYSFIGFNTHWTRKILFSMRHPKNSIIIERKKWHFDINKQQTKELGFKQEQEKLEYQNVLARSQFSLCPRGTGASTLRFWESLQAGSIPVLIADDMQLPKNFNWDSCVIRLQEKDTSNISKILHNIPKVKLTLLKENCINAYANFSGKNFIRCIREYY